MPPDPGPLDRLSDGQWRLRPRFQQRDPEQLAEERAVDEYLEEQWRRTYRFAEPWPADIRDKVHTLYRDHVERLPGGFGCMQAAYQCLETIHPDKPKYKDEGRGSLRERVYDVSEKEKKYNSVDLVMDVLQRDGQAGEPAVVTFDSKLKDTKPPAEAELLKMLDPTRPGIYFFGVSVAKGYHTVLLAVENTVGPDGKASQKIFWLDQNSKGLTNDVTGKLGAEFGKHGKNPEQPSRIWPLRPEQISRD